MFYVYVIYNSTVKKTYTGQTKNLDERLIMHNNKVLNGYTSRFDGKWEIVYKEKYKTRGEAIKREKQLKSFRGRQFIKNFIPG